MSLILKSAHHKQFMATTAAWYSGHRRRFREFCHNAEVQLDYTLEQLREWTTLLAPGFREGGSARCCYCDTPITIKSASPDHRTPITRGGPATLENLALCCRYCNRIKGKMLAHEFHALLRGLASSGFTETTVTDIKHRLATAGELADTTRRLRAQAHTNGKAGAWTRKTRTKKPSEPSITPAPAQRPLSRDEDF